jgi:hypothetical protein
MEMVRCVMASGDAGGALGCVWGGLPWWLQWGFWLCLILIVGNALSGVLLIVFRAARGLVTLAKGLAGWPGVAAVLGFAALVASILTFRRRRGGDFDFATELDGDDAKPSARRGTKRPRGVPAGDTLAK